MWDVDNWAERDAGGFGVTLGQHTEEQPGTLEMGRAVLTMQDGEIGAPDSGGAPCPPGLSPDVHEVFIHTPGRLGRHGHRDPMFLPREGERR